MQSRPPAVYGLKSAAITKYTKILETIIRLLLSKFFRLLSLRILGRIQCLICALKSNILL